MNVDPKLFDQVCDHARQAMLLHSSADALEWDERTGMPVAAGPYRAEQVSTLRASIIDYAPTPATVIDCSNLPSVSAMIRTATSVALC